jgi:hypothetical protein
MLDYDTLNFTLYFSIYGKKKRYIKPKRIRSKNKKTYNESLYAYKNVREEVFGALTVEFGDRIKTKKRESTKTRIILKIIVRWIYE